MNYGTESEQQQALNEAREQRKQQSEQQPETEREGDEESLPAGQSDTGGEVSGKPSEQQNPTTFRDAVKPDEAKFAKERACR